MDERTEQPRPLLVCQRAAVPHWFTDDVPGVCAFCGEGIYHRPHALVDMPGAVLICTLCLVGQMEQRIARGDAMRFMVTERTRGEIRKLLHGEMDA